MQSSLNFDNIDNFMAPWNDNQLLQRESFDQQLQQLNQCSQIALLSTTNNTQPPQNPDPAPQPTNPKKPRIPKETNPNILKNLVVTLRSWIDINESNATQIQIKIWKYFKHTKKVNKHLVWLLYGDIVQDLESYDGFRKQVIGLESVTVEEYRGIQRNFRLVTSQQLKQANIDYILKYRRVKNRDEFNRCFRIFASKLERGQPYSTKRGAGFYM